MTLWGSFFSDLPCGDTAFTSSSGVIELPRKLKEDGSATVNCTYTISTENTTTMSLDLGNSPLEFEQVLDSFADCNSDHIMVKNAIHKFLCRCLASI